MPRQRLGVALLIPEPFATEISGIRRALVDGSLERMPPHITLVPPVNVRDEELDDAWRILRSAASSVEPFTVSLGPVGSFMPDTPTIKLDVDDARVVALRNAVFVPPLERTLTWPFVPHVTLADEATPERIEAALGALADYRAEVYFEGVHLLREGENRRWEPIGEATFHIPR